MMMKKINRKSRFHAITSEAAKPLGPKDWEEQMQILSYGHQNVKWKKHNPVIVKYNRSAYRKLNQIRYNITEVSEDIIALMPSARWLFDNFQMMYREIKKIKSTGSYEMLPVLQYGEDRGLPRIYVVAKEMIALAGGHLDEENITLMMKAYQKNLPLSDKELWMLPEMIGLCLLKRIIEISDDIVYRIKAKNKADTFVKETLKAESRKLDVEPLLNNYGDGWEEDFSFHCHVLYLLKNMSANDDDIQKYLEHHEKIPGKYISAFDVFKEEGKIESLLESKVRALIVSLREINQLDEEKLFEDLSQLEEILSRDPAGIYSDMDAESRSFYRQSAERLALKYGMEDGDVGEVCFELAEAGREDLNHSDHVGTYLVGKGHPILKAKIRKQEPPKTLEPRNKKGKCYMFVTSLLLIAFCSLFFLWINDLPALSYQSIMLFLVALPIIVGITLEVSNNIFARFVPVKRIASMDYLSEIPDEARTFVVMPIILSSPEQGLEYLERLHSHYLANRQPNLFFALLADYSDSSAPHTSNDELITKTLEKHIRELNSKYPSAYQRFSLFFRKRKWNEAQGCYMCWERKRGKLEEFNAYITGTPKEDTHFSLINFDKSLIGTFKYVITLDADSVLVQNSASKLVGMIHHPLNNAILDESGKKIKEGYAIIQPAVRNHICDHNSGRFTKLAGGQDGLVHYSDMISDIYHDVFGEGSYIGKGIYNIEVFHNILNNKFAENRVLSHDLLESCYVRTAFTGAANILDDFPGSVISFIKREHRWIRGDWQLLPWLVKRDGLSLISKWKILDNMRRSLVPLCKVLFIILNLAFIPDAWYIWLPVVFFSEIFNIVISMLRIIAHKLRQPRLAIIYKKLHRDMAGILLRALLDVLLLPYRAYTSMDAIIKTLYRLAISKKNLLMWNSADTVEKAVANTKKGYFLHMWSALIPSAALFALLMIKQLNTPAVLFYAVVALAWAMSFLPAYYISRPVTENPLDTDDEEMLLEIARDTWSFFKDFSTKENNWLCPDNYQITNKKKVTHKTSPTNIGLQFLSVMSARDFGFETLSTTLDTAENLLYAVAILPKWNGHLYNWYDIHTLSVLEPKYVSTVDSGNFFGHLIAFKNGLKEQKNNPVIPANVLSELKTKAAASKLEGIDINKTHATYGELLKDVLEVKEKIEAKKQQHTLEDLCTLEQLMDAAEAVIREITEFGLEEESISSAVTLLDLAQDDQRYAAEQMERIDALCRIIDNMQKAADFRPLFSKKRKLFHIGYHVASQTLDSGCYDLLASESILTSFLAIARGDVPVKHWYKLGRPLTMVEGTPAFVSWSGTMFEYLMPNLVMKEYEGSVFSETSRAAVRQHIIYGNNRNIPWGVSESQYYRFDLDSNYQYKAFGVPELRLQPSIGNPPVAAPYASILALDFAPEETIQNLKKLKNMGAYGEYGYYEAVDFNGPDSVNFKNYCIVTSFMAHHQGMNLAAIDNFLNNGVMRRRFHSEPIIKAAETLLEEKLQTLFISVTKKGYAVNLKKIISQEEDILGRRYIRRVAPVIPALNYLSSNKYSLMITSDGDGRSDYKGIMIYRWRADVYANTGNYIYIKEIRSGRIWSATYHPTKAEPDEYQAIFSPHEAEFRRRDGDISTHTRVSISPDHNMEMRKITFTNHSNIVKQLQVTSYIEVVNDYHRAEISHPAFSKLFIESEFLPEESLFLSKRRGCGDEDGPLPLIMHMVKDCGKSFEQAGYENDRLKFIGRNNTVQNPDAIVEDISLSSQSGFSADPIMSLRAEITLEPGEITSLCFITGVCDSREEAIKISNELIPYRIDDLFEKARLQSGMELTYLNISRRQVNAFQDIISPLFYPCRHYRGPSENIRRNWKTQSCLWRFGISGDNPIMLLRVRSTEESGIIKDVLRAYEYYRINQLRVDLVILDETKYGYMQDLTNLLYEMTSSLKIYDESRERPGLFILHSGQMSPGEVDLLFTVARVVFSEETGIYFRNIKDSLKDIDNI
ncbi:MAG: glucoamylase family protein [Eubacteriales bacterium]|nr:glucoamylase family protein [Eubacteriales bacterium]